MNVSKIKLRERKWSAPHEKIEMILLSHLADSNRGPSLYESAALPAELRWQKLRIEIYQGNTCCTKNL